MTPPKVSDIGIPAEASETPPAVSVCAVETLRNRPDFLRTAQGKRQGTGRFMLQGGARGGEHAGRYRYGLPTAWARQTRPISHRTRDSQNASSL